MDHRKISINPGDLQKLKDLLQEEEERIDAMSDEELAEAERQLEQKIRKLARNSPSEAAPRHRDETWQEIQKRMQKQEQRSTPADESLESRGVIPLRRKQNPWGWVGALAAAALALFILYPSLQPNPPQGTMDPSQTLTKGSGTGIALSTDCAIDIRGKTNESVKELDYSQGFEVTIGEAVQIFYRCRQDGYLQVWNSGRPAEEFRNIQVVKDQTAGVPEDPTLGNAAVAEFPLQEGDSWILTFVLTDSKIGNDVDLLEYREIPEQMGKSKVLWFETIAVKGKAQ